MMPRDQRRKGVAVAVLSGQGKGLVRGIQASVMVTALNNLKPLIFL